MSILQRAKDAKSKNCDFPIGAKRRAASPEWSHLWWSETPHRKKKKRVTTVFAEPVDFVKTSRSDQDFVADPEIHGWASHWQSRADRELKPPCASGVSLGKNEIKMHLGNCREKKNSKFLPFLIRNPSSSCLMLLPWSTKMLLSVKATASSEKVTRRCRNPRNLQICRISKKLRCCTSGIRLVVNLMECTPWHSETIQGWAKQCSSGWSHKHS